MGNCLITKLKSSVDNDNLSYFDCITLHIKTDGYGKGNQRKISYGPSDNFELEIIGDGEFTDISGNTSYGKVINNENYQNSVVYVGDGEYDVLIKRKTVNKPELRFGEVWRSLPEINNTGFAGYIKNPEELKYANFNSFIDNSGLIEGSKDIPLEVFENKDNLVNLTAYVTGDISHLGNLKLLRQFYINSKTNSITGEIKSLSGCTNIQLMRFSQTKVTGDFNQLPFKNKAINVICNGLITCNGINAGRGICWIVYDENGNASISNTDPNT